MVLALLGLASGYAQSKKVTALKIRLDSLYRADQLYRSAEAQRAGGTAEEQADKSRKQAVIDVSNLAAIEKIIAVHGYPGRSLVGKQYETVALMIIQHNDPDAREKYLPLLTVAAEKGELPGSSLALVIDRSKTDKGEKQIYGTQLHETNSGVKLMPIEDEPNVNVRRKKMGLSPLEDYLKQWNITYRVPTATYQNPPELYYVPEVRTESPVELIGGYEAFYRTLAYPAKAKDNSISGFVTVELTVDKNGVPQNAQVVKPLGYGCDEEAVRAIRSARFINRSGEDHEMRIRVPFPYSD